MAKVLIEQVDGRVKFTFTESSHYQYNGTADWPLNSLSMTIDNSSMVTFKNQAGDIVYSILLADLEKSKAEMEELYADVFVGDTGGGGGGTVDPALDSGSTNPVANSAITAAMNAKADASIVEALSDAVDIKEEVVARALTDLHENKQDKLTAGSGITISGNVISAEGGVVVDPALDSGSTNPVANSAITAAIDAKAGKSVALGGYVFGETNGIENVKFRNVNNDNVGNPIYYPKINGKGILTSNDSYASNNYLFSLVETSAITTSMTSSSTNAQVPSAKAVYDQLGGLKLVKCTQAEYSAMEQAGTLDSSTLYVITNVV